MMHASGKARSAKAGRRLVVLSVAIAGLGLAGCDDHGGDPGRQIGANPMLPQLQQYVMPPIRIAKAVGWGKNETPAVPEGLQIHALATGFQHPRSLYVLPNGDVLVVESNGPKAPIDRPKDIVTKWVQWFAGAEATDANRITLLRDTNGDGVPELRTVFLDHLNSPFGIALVGHDLYSHWPCCRDRRYPASSGAARPCKRRQRNGPSNTRSWGRISQGGVPDEGADTFWI